MGRAKASDARIAKQAREAKKVQDANEARDANNAPEGQPNAPPTPEEALHERLIGEARNLNGFLTFIRLGLIFYLSANAIFNALFVAVRYNAIKNRSLLDKMLSFSATSGDLMNYIDFLYCQPELSTVLIVLLIAVYGRKFLKNLSIYESSIADGQLPQFDFAPRTLFFLLAMDVTYLVGNIFSTYNSCGIAHIFKLGGYKTTLADNVDYEVNFFTKIIKMVFLQFLFIVDFILERRIGQLKDHLHVKRD